MQFNLRRTLHATPVRHREEISSLLQTTVAANADCHVPCAGPASNRSDLARLNLKPAAQPLGIPAMPTTGYSLVESNNGPVRLTDGAYRWRCLLCLCCMLVLVGGGVGLAYGLRPSSSSSSAPVAAGPPPPPYVATPLWGRLSTRNIGKIPGKRPVRRSAPPPPRKSPPPPSAALPDSDLVLDILEHGTGE